MSDHPDKVSPIRTVLLGSRTMIFFVILLVLGAVVPFVRDLWTVGSSHLGWPYAFHYDRGSIQGGRTWTGWDVLATDVAIYYAAAAIMGLVGVLRGRSRRG